MKLATLRGEGPDGRLVVVSRMAFAGCRRTRVAPDPASRRSRTGTAYRDAEAAQRGPGGGQGEALDASLWQLPSRARWQWLDGSAFPTHGALMQKAFNLPPIETDAPLMYQGMSHQFLGPHDDVPLPSEADGIDFEGEFAVITDAVPMGVSVAEAADHIKLIVQLNDWSLRVIAPVEMKTGFGWVRAKPACSVAPFAVTPEELGPAWRDGRVCLDLRIDWNGRAIRRGQRIGHGIRLRRTGRPCRLQPQPARRHDHRFRNGIERELPRGGLLLHRRATGHRDHRPGAPKTSFMRFGDGCAWRPNRWRAAAPSAPSTNGLSAPAGQGADQLRHLTFRARLAGTSPIRRRHGDGRAASDR